MDRTEIVSNVTLIEESETGLAEFCKNVLGDDATSKSMGFKRRPTAVEPIEPYGTHRLESAVERSNPA